MTVSINDSIIPKKSSDKLERHIVESYFIFLPALVKITIVFLLIVFLINRKFLLGTALVSGSFLLGIFFMKSFSEIPILFLKTLISEDMIVLGLLVYSIHLLSSLMSKAGSMDLIVSSFSNLFRSTKLSYLFFPAIVGLLPMPGGALFSCPMVESASKHDSTADNLNLSIYNYWFRHIWEYSWPLYPGLILVYSLVPGMKFIEFLALQLPFVFLAIFYGYFFLLRDNEIEENSSEMYLDELMDENDNKLGFLKGVFPIIIIIGFYIFFLTLEKYQPSSGIFNYLSPKTFVLPGVFFSIIYLIFSWKIKKEIVVENMKSPNHLKMAFMVLGIVNFSAFLSKSGAAIQMTEEFVKTGIPLMYIVILLPFISGMVSGITVAFVGSSYPILISILSTVYPDAIPVNYIILGFVSGFMGVMLSPVHLCLILTSEYFDVNLKDILFKLIEPAFCMMVSSIAYFYILKRLF